MLNSIQSDLIRGHINTIILKSLFEGDRYGYDIVKEIEQKSGGQYKLKQPTLYSCLKRLEVQGFIRSYWGTKSNGGRRKYFTLTDEGKDFYQKSQTEWEYSRTIIDKLISDKTFDMQSIGDELFLSEESEAESENDKEFEEFTDEAQDEIKENSIFDSKKSEENSQPIAAFESSPAPSQTEAVRFLDTSQIMRQLFDQNQVNGYFENIKQQKIKVEAQELQSSAHYFRDFSDDEVLQTPEEAYEQKEQSFGLDTAFRTFDEQLSNYTKPSEPPLERAEQATALGANSGFFSYDTSKAAIDERKIILEREYKNVLTGLIKPSEPVPIRAATPPFHSEQEIVSAVSPIEAMAKEQQFKDNTYVVEAPIASDKPDGLTKDKLANKKLDKLAVSVKEMGDNFKIRSHNSRASKEYSNAYYYYSNKLMLAHYGIMFGIMLLEIVFCFLFIRIGLQKQQKFDLIMYLLSVITAAAFPLTAFFMNVVNANKRKRINFDMKNSLIFRFILMGLLWLIIYCINIYLKMPLTFSAEYMNSLILPALLSTSFPISAIVFNALYKTKRYSVEN